MDRRVCNHRWTMTTVYGMGGPMKVERCEICGEMRSPHPGRTSRTIQSSRTESSEHPSQTNRTEQYMRKEIASNGSCL